jgi:ABC-2 type transport system ATP-binding protein
VRVRSPRADELSRRLSAAGAGVELEDDGSLSVSEMTAAEIGELALGIGAPLHELSPQTGSLEEAFMELTHDSVEYRGETGGPGDVAGAPASQLAGTGEGPR